MRKLASIQEISDITPIDNADNIELATVKGWKVVVKKGEFTIGNKCVYFEIDSLLPQVQELSFLANKGVKTIVVEGKQYTGYRLRTIKLRGRISQGLVLPIPSLDNIYDELGLPRANFNLDDDLTSTLGIVKYEIESPIAMQGQAKGTFPAIFPRTDLERIQNIGDFLERNRDRLFQLQEKVDGQSLSIYRYQDECGLCSRNLELKEIETDERWNTVKRLGLFEKLKDQNTYPNICLQGEFIGLSIQSNRLDLKERTILMFDAFNIDEQKYLTPHQFIEFCKSLGIKTVPVLADNFPIVGENVDSLLAMAVRNSEVTPGVMLEGIAFKAVDDYIDFRLGRPVFKCINNEYLLKHGI